MAFRRKSLLNSVCFVGVEGSGIDSIIVILLYSYFASIPMFYYVGSDVRRWLHRAARAHYAKELTTISLDTSIYNNTLIQLSAAVPSEQGEPLRTTAPHPAALT